MVRVHPRATSIASSRREKQHAAHEKNPQCPTRACGAHTRTINLTAVAAPEVRRSKLINAWCRSGPAVDPSDSPCARACRLHSGNSPGQRSPDLKHCRSSARAHPYPYPPARPHHHTICSNPCTSRSAETESQQPRTNGGPRPPRPHAQPSIQRSTPFSLLKIATTHTHTPLALHRAQMRGSTRR